MPQAMNISNSGVAMILFHLDITDNGVARWMILALLCLIAIHHQQLDLKT